MTTSAESSERSLEGSNAEPTISVGLEVARAQSATLLIPPAGIREDLWPEMLESVFFNRPTNDIKPEILAMLLPLMTPEQALAVVEHGNSDWLRTKKNGYIGHASKRGKKEIHALLRLILQSPLRDRLLALQIDGKPFILGVMGRSDTALLEILRDTGALAPEHQPKPEVPTPGIETIYATNEVGARLAALETYLSTDPIPSADAITNLYDQTEQRHIVQWCIQAIPSQSGLAERLRNAISRLLTLAPQIIAHRDVHGATPLNTAIRCTDAKSAEILMTAGADPIDIGNDTDPELAMAMRRIERELENLPAGMRGLFSLINLTAQRRNDARNLESLRRIAGMVLERTNVMARGTEMDAFVGTVLEEEHLAATVDATLPTPALAARFRTEVTDDADLPSALVRFLDDSEVTESVTRKDFTLDMLTDQEGQSIVVRLLVWPNRLAARVAWERLWDAFPGDRQRPVQLRLPSGATLQAPPIYLAALLGNADAYGNEVENGVSDQVGARLEGDDSLSSVTAAQIQHDPEVRERVVQRLGLDLADMPEQRQQYERGPVERSVRWVRERVGRLTGRTLSRTGGMPEMEFEAFLDGLFDRETGTFIGVLALTDALRHHRLSVEQIRDLRNPHASLSRTIDDAAHALRTLDASGLEYLRYRIAGQRPHVLQTLASRSRQPAERECMMALLDADPGLHRLMLPIPRSSFLFRAHSSATDGQHSQLSYDVLGYLLSSNLFGGNDEVLQEVTEHRERHGNEIVWEDTVIGRDTHYLKNVHDAAIVASVSEPVTIADLPGEPTRALLARQQTKQERITHEAKENASHGWAMEDITRFWPQGYDPCHAYRQRDLRGRLSHERLEDTPFPDLIRAGHLDQAIGLVESRRNRITPLFVSDLFAYVFGSTGIASGSKRDALRRIMSLDMGSIGAVTAARLESEVRDRDTHCLELADAREVFEELDLRGVRITGNQGRESSVLPLIPGLSLEYLRRHTYLVNGSIDPACFVESVLQSGREYPVNQILETMNAPKGGQSILVHLLVQANAKDTIPPNRASAYRQVLTTLVTQDPSLLTRMFRAPYRGMVARPRISLLGLVIRLGDVTLLEALRGLLTPDIRDAIAYEAGPLGGEALLKGPKGAIDMNHLWNKVKQGTTKNRYNSLSYLERLSENGPRSDRSLDKIRTILQSV